MKTNQIFLSVLYIVLLSSLSACGKNDNTTELIAENKIKSFDVCSLLTQEEVNSLFVVSPGPGKASSPSPHIQGCVWPAEGISDLIVQVLPAPTNIMKSINMGDGYRVIEVEGMSGQAAAAIQKGNPKYGITEGLAIYGIVKGDIMVTFSPVRLDIQEKSPQFELLKKLANSAVMRL